jgi:hypothetical protein
VVGWGIVCANVSPHCLFWRDVVKRFRTDGFTLQGGGEHTSVLQGRGSWPSQMVGAEG